MSTVWVNMRFHIEWTYCPKPYYPVSIRFHNNNNNLSTHKMKNIETQISQGVKQEKMWMWLTKSSRQNVREMKRKRTKCTYYQGISKSQVSQGKFIKEQI